MSEFPPPKYIDDVTCREFWGEASQVLLGPPGTVRIEICVYRWTPEVPVHIDRVVPVARVAIPMSLAQLLRDQLNSTIEHAQSNEALSQAPAASSLKN